MALDPETQWQSDWIAENTNFAEACARFRDSNPSPSERTALNAIMIHLATELWDRYFSQAEIRTAFAMAVEALPGYAAGEERRGDRY